MQNALTTAACCQHSTVQYSKASLRHSVCLQLKQSVECIKLQPPKIAKSSNGGKKNKTNLMETL